MLQRLLASRRALLSGRSKRPKMLQEVQVQVQVLMVKVKVKAKMNTK
jgi:hypothetical protein